MTGDLSAAKARVEQSKINGREKRKAYKEQMSGRPAAYQTIWKPQYREDGRPGPQVALVTCPFDEILFGGARGGGKTDGALGCWLQHVARYGENAKGVFFRRRFKQLEEVQFRCNQIFPKLGALYHKGDAIWIFPNGASLKLRHLWDESSCEEYQGHSYCVAAGTPILMGDGTYRPIEAIQAGDLVMTLEGPKPVTETMPARVSPCVRAEVYDARGVKLGEQIHPEDHPFLTNAGLPSLQSRDGSQSGAQLRRSHEPWQSYTTLLDAHLATQEAGAYQASGQSGYRESGDERLDAQPLPELSCPIVLHSPERPSEGAHSGRSTRYRTSGKSSGLSEAIRQGFPGISRNLRRQFVQLLLWLGHNKPNVVLVGGGGAYVPPVTRTVPSSLRRYSGGSRPCGEQFRFSAEGDQVSSPSRDDAEELGRDVIRAGGTDYTPECSRQEPLQYIHPYTREQRHVTIPVELGTVRLVPCGRRLVYDLTVKDANHYITESGLINKNSFLVFEEVTNWPVPNPILKMSGTLRSASGVHPQMILTANPGGAGHNWVKARFRIAQYKSGYVPINDEETGLTRIYIPSRLEDNIILTKNDPNYEKRLLQSGNAALVKAWRWGDWDIISGGFFDDIFDPDRHLVPPFEIPAGWKWRRSFDWGSAAPASLGVWAISDGNPIEHSDPKWDGFVFPRGSLIRVSEWYTVARDAAGNIRPNEGLRHTNITLGNGIGQRSMGRTWSGCVADPSIFAKPGRDSIYDEMRKGAMEVGHHLNFNPADNNRIAGWQRMRDMLEAAAKEIPEKPGLWSFDTCEHYVRTIPVLQRKENELDDIDTDQEDHVADEVRYICMTGPRTLGIGRLTGT